MSRLSSSVGYSPLNGGYSPLNGVTSPLFDRFEQFLLFRPAGDGDQQRESGRIKGVLREIPVKDGLPAGLNVRNVKNGRKRRSGVGRVRKEEKQC